MNVTWEAIRADVIGRDARISTPYGDRALTYADFTASGRALGCIERYVRELLELYANTHTEDDTTGRLTSRRLADAERIIKQRLNADQRYKLIAVGAGATAAVNRLQQILGIYLAPATRDRLVAAGFRELATREVEQRMPVVFVGPYEHHSNEISWREGLAEVVEIELNERGYFDLADLERKLQDPRYRDRPRIGSFSAASNVSGIRTRIYDVARMLHRHGALAFFDFSASAPYVRIDVNRDEESYFDGVFFSPHKYLGGPGASGLLLIRDSIYRADLPPSVSGGGTVSFVNWTEQDYVEDIEEREKAGTPGIIQTIRAALAIDLQHELGPERIEDRERTLMARALERLGAVDSLEIIGDAPAEDRLAIFSFNVRSGRGYLHPRFVVRLLNDLFGIQARAGCSCAGPYGHRLLHIDLETSELYRRYIREGSGGIKPGWVRLNFHYLISDREFDFICNAIEFVARYGHFFLREYRFDIRSGAWVHLQEPEDDGTIGAAAAVGCIDGAAASDRGAADEAQRLAMREGYLEAALEHARRLEGEFREGDLRETTEELIPFWYIQAV